MKLKPYPRQTYSLLTTNRPILPALLGYDYIKGHRIRTGWLDVQPDLTSKTNQNWDYIDSVLEDCGLDGRKAGIGVSAGVTVPQDLFTKKGVTQYTLRPEDQTIENAEFQNLAMPWEEGYHKYWFNFIRQMGLRFDGNPLVSYVVVSGFMQLMENRFVGTTEGDADLQVLAKEAGYTDFSEGYMVGAQKIIDQYCLCFPTTTLLLSMAGVIPSDKQLGNELMDWAKLKYPGRFGPMTCSLKAKLPPNPPNTNPALTFPKWDQPIYSSADQARFYGKDTVPDPFPVPPQCADDLLGNAQGNDKNDFGVELYEYDAKNPINADVIRARNAQFEANAAKAETIRGTTITPNL